MAEEIADMRVRARLSCRYGDCFWTVQSASASELDRLWREHSAEHWEIEPTDLLPRPLGPASASDSGEQVRQP